MFIHSTFNESILLNGSSFNKTMLNQSTFNESMLNQSTFTESMLLNGSALNESTLNESYHICGIDYDGHPTLILANLYLGK